VGEDAASELAEFLASLIGITGALNGLIAKAVADMAPEREPEWFDDVKKAGQDIHREIKTLQARLSERFPESR